MAMRPFATFDTTESGGGFASSLASFAPFLWEHGGSPARSGQNFATASRMAAAGVSPSFCRSLRNRVKSFRTSVRKRNRNATSSTT